MSDYRRTVQLNSGSSHAAQEPATFSLYSGGKTLRVTCPLVLIKTTSGAYRYLYDGETIVLDEVGAPMGFDLGDVRRLIRGGFLEEADQ